MQGSLLFIPAEPSKPRRMIFLNEWIPEFETIQVHENDAKLRRCVSFCRDLFEAQLEGEKPNPQAQSL